MDEYSTLRARPRSLSYQVHEIGHGPDALVGHGLCRLSEAVVHHPGHGGPQVG